MARADALQAQVVLILAEVRQLDHRVTRLEMGARERERVLLRDDLHAPGATSCIRARDAAEGERGERADDDERASLDERDALEAVRASG